MNKLIKISALFIFVGFISCDYLDVVPKDAATLDHAFSNRAVTRMFLTTCYNSLPDPTNPYFYPTYFTSRDEFDYGNETRAANTHGGRIARGLQNTNDPYLNYWSGLRGGIALYQGIRDCNIFLNNIHIPQDMMPEEKERWIAEVKFLKAYYHFFLMQLYGPIVIADEEVPLSASPEELQVYREPVDVVVDYIVELLDEAIPDLPLNLPDPSREQGQITKPIALGVKAKVLATAASPLFNGNTDYSGWVDNRGIQLISSDYDRSKWERATEAIKNAIDTCHIAGYRLYEFNKYSGGPTFNMNDTLVQLMTIRKSITEDFNRNPGVIWATQAQFSDGKGGVSYSHLGNMLRVLFPQIYTEDQLSSANYLYASWHTAQMYYTNNGVPMEEDKYYNYTGRYNLRRATPGDKHQSYIATGQTTVELHFNREPRFYAGLGFDRGYFELSTTTQDGGATFGPYMRFRAGEVKLDHLGYVPKKIIHFESSCSQGDINKRYSQHNYQFPLLRLADLYLLYSEALNEVKDQPDEEVYFWIDEIREKAGLTGVVESWAAASVNPDKPLSKNGMREIIQKERLIELIFEGQRFWDIRRWKIADQYWSLPPMRWGRSRVDEEYYVPEVYGDTRQVTFRDYLYPLRNYDLRINKNLVQTYGW